MARTRKWKLRIVVALMVILGAASTATLISVRFRHPVTLRGAVIKRNSDTRNQSPIADVWVSTANGESLKDSNTDFSGLFQLNLDPTITAGQLITLTFRHPDYQPLNLDVTASDKLYVVEMIPLQREAAATPNEAESVIGNILVRYSTETTTSENVGTAVKTFQIANTGNVPCNKQTPCSPDGKWKAATGSESLNAGAGNVFRNARVICISGPCPFTKIDTDEFSAGGQTIKVSVRNWSGTTTFLLQAEVFRQQIGETIRASYPVIYGRSMNFTLPESAEGPTIQAELNGTLFFFPLGPRPTLSWAVCNVRVEKSRAKDFRCELKPGFKFNAP